MTDRDYMRLGLDLAARGLLTARPNPMVGAVVVKDGQIVGSGFHERPGEGHAEVNALRDVSEEAAEGATVFVTLEPCSVVERTPACADLLIERSVGKVVCAMEDPDTRVRGSGIARMRDAGIDVTVGVLEDEARRLNAAYVTHRSEGRAYVTLKMAQSLDGSIATESGDSKWITGQAARTRGHRLRAEAQAIGVGVGTVLADDPQLDVRHVEGEDPIKVVFDSKLRTPTDAKVLDRGRCIVCTTEDADEDRSKALRDRGADVWVCEDVEGQPDVQEVLERLAREDVTHLLVEGGAALAGSFVRARRADRVKIFNAPRLIGGKGWPAGLQFDTVEQAVHLERCVFEQIGDDLLVTADVSY